MGKTEKSAHTLTRDKHEILFEETQILANQPSYYPRIYRET